MRSHSCPTWRASPSTSGWPSEAPPRRSSPEFEGTFATETIELFLQTSYDQFANRARFTNFLPLMAQRFARQRLRALARVEGKSDDSTPIVLFLCVHNAGRSQMALGWFNHLAGGQAVACRRADLGTRFGSTVDADLGHRFDPISMTSVAHAPRSRGGRARSPASTVI